MALQSSGAITLAQIAAEFGGAAPHAISEYYRGGIYVPDTAANIAIPTSGQIKLSDFYGAQAATVATVTEGSRTYTATGGNTTIRGYCAANKGWNNSGGFATMAACGSRTPTAYNGVTIEGLYYYEGSASAGMINFLIVLQGTRAQNFFSQAVVQGGSTLLTANATEFKQVSSSTYWRWYLGSSDVWPTWDGTGTRTVTLT